MNYYCNKGHHLKVIDGPCRECARERQADQRHRNAEGRHLAQALREHRVPLDIERLAEGHRLLMALEMARDPVPTY